MGQEWILLNLSKGIILPSLGDGSKYMEKYYSIYALIFLLQNEWKGDKVIMLGEYDEESKQYTNEFLSVYGLSYEGEDNLVYLKYEDILPKASYKEVIWTKKMKNMMDPFHRIQEILDGKKDDDKNDYLMTSTKKVLLKDIPTDNIYIFVNYTKKEYVKFDKEFFQGFYTTNYDDERIPLRSTLPIFNGIQKNIIQALISHKNYHSDCERGYTGRFCGDSLGFIKETEFTQIHEYKNIYEDLIRMDYVFETHTGQTMEEVNGKRGFIMYEYHIHYDKDFIESD